MSLSIWVDADACPKACKDLLIRAARRTEIPVIFVANRPVQVPESEFIRAVQVGAGMDVADNEIVLRCQAGDLVITNDIPLAWEALEKGVKVVTPRGQEHTPENIRSRLTMRDFMETLRASGVETGGPRPRSDQDSHAFANYLDRYLQKACRKH
ncbi:MAG: hypothetical protein ACI8W8_000645 [Rhodothermales bacterium]|jgi:uncharacterized protein YaiI (UPF0178 family)